MAKEKGGDAKGGPGGADRGTGTGEGSEGADLSKLVEEFGRQMAEAGKQFKEAFEKVQEEAQYQFDKEMGRFIARHPDLYAEMQKTLRQIRKTADKAADAFGLKKE